jgi:signal transduction histidine kinase
LQRKRLGWVLDGVAVLVIGGWIAASRAPATVPEWAAACTTLVMMAISGATAITVRILVDRYDAKTDALVAEHFEDGRLEERLALARDLHDTVTKTLFGCAAYARVQARDLEARRDPLADRERKLVRLLEAAESEARHFLVQLRSDSPEDVDYSSGIAALAKHYDGLKFHYSGDFPAPSNVQTQLLLHRAVRELLENVYRHSGSGQVWMDSHREGDVITFSVRDDGCGFDTSTLADKARLGHYGLAGVRETATDLCGTVDIESGPDGTLVELRVPAM